MSTLAITFQRILRGTVSRSTPKGWMGKEENWEGLPTQWAFTFLGEGPARGATFYVAAGTGAQVIRQRAQAKRLEFEETTA